MKKLLLLVLSLTISVAAFSSCGFFGGLTSSPAEQSSSEYQEKKYTVTFKQPGYDDVVITVTEGDDVTTLPQPRTKVGYTVEWEIVNLNDVKKNIVVNAVEKANEYTITYDANGGSVSSQTQKVKYDSNVVLATPTYEGYEFAGWKDADGNAVTDGAWKIAKNVTLKASWNPIGNYKITFKQDGCADIVKTIVKGGTLAEADIPTPEAVTGYDVAWSVTDFSNITSDTVVTVVKTAKQCLITYDANGGTVTPATQTVTYGENETLAVPEKENCTFKGWYTADDKLVTGENWSIADSNVTLRAKWEENAPVVETVKVTFKQEGCADIEKTVNKGETLTDIPTPKAVTGYDVAWDVTDFSNLTENKTVNAVKTAKKYTVSFDALDKATNPASMEVTFATNVTLPDLADTEAYAFMGWTYEDKAVTGENWSIASNVTLKADWQIKQSYKVTFVQAGCQDQAYDVYEGAMFEQNVSVKEVEGYTIVWNETELAQLESPITGNVTINAVITPNTYTITVDLADGSATTTKSVTYGAAYNLGTPTRTGYTFKGWKLGNQTITKDGEWGIALEKSDVTTVTAVWEANTYTVKLINDSETQEITVTYGQEVTLPTPTKAGYVFVGWKYNSTTILKDKVVWTLEVAEGSWIELTAEWDDDEQNWTNNY